MRVDVALATCTATPEHDADMAPLLEGLRGAGLAAETLAWDDADAGFGGARLVLVRSTWNYTDHLPTFLAWADRVGAMTALHNPADVLRWNAHKGYLLDLRARGVPVVPTVLVRRGEGAAMHAIAGAQGWDEIVVKPAVSAGSRRTVRIGRHDHERGAADLRRLTAEGDALVQPFLPSVEGSGERAIVCFDGVPSHAVRKSPRFEGDDEHVSGEVPIADDERRLARRTIAALGRVPLYARVDVARDAAGQPCLMEVELIEPSLFLTQCPHATGRLVAALASRLRG